MLLHNEYGEFLRAMNHTLNYKSIIMVNLMKIMES